MKVDLARHEFFYRFKWVEIKVLGHRKYRERLGEKERDEEGRGKWRERREKEKNGKRKEGNTKRRESESYREMERW